MVIIKMHYKSKNINFKYFQFPIMRRIKSKLFLWLV